MLEGELVLAHLRQNCADVQVDVAWVRHLQAVVHGLLAEVQVVVLNLEGFFEEGKCGAQLLRPPENASKVVVGHGTVAISLVRVRFRLLEELKRH